MKLFKTILAAMFAISASAAMAQDFSGPQYANWGENATGEQRKENILKSGYLKDAYQQKDYAKAATILKELLSDAPKGSMNIYIIGSAVYQNRIARAKSLAEKKVYVDSLLTLYDLRAVNFGNHAKYNTAYILDRKAHDFARFNPTDREGMREVFQEAIEAGGNAAKPETIVVYFNNLADDYNNTDEIVPDQMLEEYERLGTILESTPEGREFKSQIDAIFAQSGVANCDNLEKMFKDRLAAEPENKDLYAKVVALMGRANCESEFFLATTEKYYAMEPSSQTALFLAQAFQGQGQFDKALTYLQEALATENDATERENLLTRIALIELNNKQTSKAMAAARQIKEINPESGIAYFILAQGYGASAGACSGLEGQAVYWVAYDTANKAATLLGESSEYYAVAQQLSRSYRSGFPSSEDIFMNGLSVGQAYTVKCGTASGITTTVRAR